MSDSQLRGRECPRTSTGMVKSRETYVTTITSTELASVWKRHVHIKSGIVGCRGASHRHVASSTRFCKRKSLPIVHHRCKHIQHGMPTCLEHAGQGVRWSVSGHCFRIAQTCRHIGFSECLVHKLISEVFARTARCCFLQLQYYKCGVLSGALRVRITDALLQDNPARMVAALESSAYPHFGQIHSWVLRGVFQSCCTGRIRSFLFWDHRHLLAQENHQPDNANTTTR